MAENEENGFGFELDNQYISDQIINILKTKLKLDSELHRGWSRHEPDYYTISLKINTGSDEYPNYETIDSMQIYVGDISNYILK